MKIKILSNDKLTLIKLGTNFIQKYTNYLPTGIMISIFVKQWFYQ